MPPSWRCAKHHVRGEQLDNQFLQCHHIHDNTMYVHNTEFTQSLCNRGGRVSYYFAYLYATAQ